MATLREWLGLAPKPPELSADQDYHFFVSYRSIDRPFVLRLHDALEGLGFKLFVDQFALTQSGTLIKELGEAFDRSAGGIVVWSKERESSRWCGSEFDSFEDRATEDGRFVYAVAALDEAKVPGFAKKRLRQDFSGQPGGPYGEALLRLICGALRETLPEEAVHAAAEVDEATRDARNRIKAARKTGNSERLIELATSDSLAWVSQPALPCAVAEALIKLGKYAEAFAVLDRVGSAFPKATRPKQLRGLALARSGNWRDAQEILETLYAAGERDPETLGILGRTWMDRYAESGNKLHLTVSRNHYAEAFDLDESDYYTGINAAAKSVFLGELPAAQEYAARVETLVGSEAVPGDYWQTATVAENLLIGRQFDKATKLYAAAVAMDPEAIGSHESTFRQAMKLADVLKPSPEERKAIEDAFPTVNRPV